MPNTKALYLSTPIYISIPICVYTQHAGRQQHHKSSRWVVFRPPRSPTVDPFTLLHHQKWQPSGLLSLPLLQALGHSLRFSQCLEGVNNADNAPESLHVPSSLILLLPFILYLASTSNPLSLRTSLPSSPPFACPISSTEHPRPSHATRPPVILLDVVVPSLHDPPRLVGQLFR